MTHTHVWAQTSYAADSHSVLSFEISRNYCDNATTVLTLQTLLLKIKRSEVAGNWQNREQIVTDCEAGNWVNPGAESKTKAETRLQNWSTLLFFGSKDTYKKVSKY